MMYCVIRIPVLHDFGKGVIPSGFTGVFKNPCILTFGGILGACVGAAIAILLGSGMVMISFQLLTGMLAVGLVLPLPVYYAMTAIWPVLPV